MKQRSSKPVWWVHVYYGDGDVDMVCMPSLSLAKRLQRVALTEVASGGVVRVVMRPPGGTGALAPSQRSDRLSS